MVLFCVFLSPPMALPACLDKMVWLGWTSQHWLHCLGLRCCLHHLDPGLGGQGVCFPQHFSSLYKLCLYPFKWKGTESSLLSSEAPHGPSLYFCPLNLPLSLRETQMRSSWIFYTHSEGTFIFECACLSSLPLNRAWNLGKGKANTWQSLQR